MAEIQNADNTKGGEAVEYLIPHWWECKMVQSLWRHCGGWYKTKQTLPISNNWGPWYLPKWVENSCSSQNLHMDIYSNFIHNCQNLETTKKSLNYLLAIKPKKDRGETQMHITKWHSQSEKASCCMILIIWCSRKRKTTRQ